MTPAALALARDGDSAATAAAVTLWKSIVGDPDADPVIPAASNAADWGRYASVALSLVSEHAGSSTDLPGDVLREAVIRAGGYLRTRQGMTAGLVRVTDSGPEFHPSVGSALRRSGAQALLVPWTPRRAGVI